MALRDDSFSESFAIPREIKNGEDLKAAAAQRRAFVFVSVEWAVDSKLSELDVVAMVKAWQKAHPSLSAPLYRIDLTEQEGPLWNDVADWLKRGSPLIGLMSSGTGPLLWILQGRIADHVPSAHYVGREALAEQTRALFDSN